MVSRGCLSDNTNARSLVYEPKVRGGRYRPDSVREYQVFHVTRPQLGAVAVHLHTV
jgi:hypothetical protein